MTHVLHTKRSLFIYHLTICETKKILAATLAMDPVFSCLVFVKIIFFNEFSSKYQKLYKLKL